MTELIHHFATAVRHLREDRGWSQERLAERSDLNRSFVGELERGEAVPSLATIAKLADAFGLSPSSLMAQCESRKAAPRAAIGLG